MWKEISVGNFRVFGEKGLSLELAPLTVLIGENGTGKSAFLEALALTAQSVHDPQQRRGLALSGELVDLPHASDAMNRERFLYHKRQIHSPMFVELVWAGWDEEKKRQAQALPKPFLWSELSWPPEQIAYRWEKTLEPPTWRHLWKADGVALLEIWRESQEIAFSQGSYSMQNRAKIHGFPAPFDAYAPDSLLRLEPPFHPPFALPPSLMHLLKC